MQRLMGEVISCAGIAPRTFLLWIEAPAIARLSEPGQFVTLACGDEALLRRPFSVHDADSNRIAILFSVVGKGTLWLSHRRPGDSLDILGPLGNGFAIDSRSRNLLLVAGGIGIAPLVFLARRASRDGLSVKIIFGAASASHLLPLPSDVDALMVTEDGSMGRKGLATDFLPELAEWADEIFACGPIPMYRTMARMIRHHSGKRVQVLLEQVMGCGIGACRGCSIPTRGGMKTVCRDGPVFDLEEIIWEGVPEAGVLRFTELDSA